MEDARAFACVTRGQGVGEEHVMYVVEGAEENCTVYREFANKL